MELSQYLIIGNFFPGKSFLHRLDPRSKLIFAFTFIIFIFLANNLTGYSFLLLFTLTSMLVSRIPFTYYIKGLLPVIWMVVFVVVFHLLMTREGDIVFQWHWLVIYSFGIKQAIFISLRLIMLVLVASMLTLTTSPMDLTMGLERLMSPLKYFKFPVSELALMMSISLRFIPTLLEETEKIIKAQKARGANFESGPIFKRVINLISIIIPLFINAFKRAEDLANAMEARGYRGGEGRTRLRTTNFTWRDVLLFFVFIIMLIIMLYLRG